MYASPAYVSLKIPRNLSLVSSPTSRISSSGGYTLAVSARLLGHNTRTTYCGAHVQFLDSNVTDNILWCVALVQGRFQLSFCLVIETSVEIGPVEPKCHFAKVTHLGKRKSREGGQKEWRQKKNKKVCTKNRARPFVFVFRRSMRRGIRRNSESHI